MGRRTWIACVGAFALGALLSHDAPGHAAAQDRRGRRRARRVTPPPVRVPAPEPEHGPTPGCAPECYSSCGGGAHRDAMGDYDARAHCAGCRNVCMDTGIWPPAAAR